MSATIKDTQGRDLSIELDGDIVFITLVDSPQVGISVNINELGRAMTLVGMEQEDEQ